tara:strand:+ start:253 stop:636 length:384 start_codon:yes stop_codon:yes gene_type:complete
MTEKQTLTVFYDGSCPLCSREIALYQRQRGAETICWLDVADQTLTEGLPEGISRDQLMQRFHVQDNNGRVQTGGDAFLKLWASLPNFRPLAWLFSLPPMRCLVNKLYDAILPVRPRLQALFSQSKQP